MKSRCTTVFLMLLNATTFSWGETEIRPEVLSKGMYENLLEQERTNYDAAIAYEKMKPMHERNYVRPKYYQEEIEAVKQMKREALAGDRHAQCILADYFQRGYIVSQDSDRAEEFYKKSMAQNHADGYYGLGYLYCYRSDIILVKNSRDNRRMYADKKIALKYFRQAAKLGQLV